MLRFFRQIRQRLLTDNKFSKYLLYAVGEILLVVIGILIALQVDGWNQERKDRIKEHQILESLVEDFSSNDSILDTTLVDISGQINNWTIVLDIVNTPDSEIDPSYDGSGDQARVVNTDFVVSNFIDGTLSSVLSSDKLELIRDIKLKKLLTAYPSYIDGYRQTEAHLQDYVINVQRPMVRSYISLGDFFLDPKEYAVYRTRFRHRILMEY